MRQHDQSISWLGSLIWTIGALFFLYEFFLRTFVGSIAHQVIPALHLNAETFALLETGYYIVYSAMQVPTGILVDKFGVKLVMLVATLTCAGGTLLFAHADTFGFAFISRMLMGFGSSFAFICLLMITRSWFPRKFFGLFAGLSQFFGTLGPLLAGGPLVIMLTQLHESWRVVMSVIAMFGVVLAVAALGLVKNGPSRVGQIRFVSFEQPLWQRLARLAKNPQVWFVALFSGVMYVPAPLLGAVWGTYFLEAHGFSQTLAATLVSLIWAGYAIGNPVFGFISDMMMRRKPAMLMAAVLGIIASTLIVYLSSASAWGYGVLFFCLGFASGGQNVGFAIIAEHVDERIKASALGVNNGMIMFFGAMVPPLVSLLIHLPTGNHVHMLPSDFTYGFLAMPLACVIAALLVIFCVKETYCRAQKEPTFV